MQKIASGHIDDAVTPDDIESMIRIIPERKKLQTEEPDMTTSVKDTDTTIQTPESVITTKPTRNPAHDFEDDFHDPYWN